MSPTFFDKIQGAHQMPKGLPGVEEVEHFIEQLLPFLFPELNEERYHTDLEISTHFQLIRLSFEGLLYKTEACDNAGVQSLCAAFFEELERVYDLCIEDSEAILAGDPAAVDAHEVIRCYPGFFAIAVYRIAHAIYQLGVPYIPRILTEYAHSKTGIDIHPGAIIGQRFCIDHGTGIVIGETSHIGHDVKLYQGVTLGALSVSKEMAKQKRHPTLEDHVVIYAGSTILGGNTTIGSNSIIGGNVWLTESVPPHSKVYYQADGQLTVK